MLISMEARKKILFLDVDGVLHPVCSSNLFAANQVQQLQRIVSTTGCSIVLSTSWRLRPRYKEALEAHIVKWGIDPPLDSTPSASSWPFCTPKLSVGRAGEIDSWLQTNRHLVDFPRWAVLDDIDMTEHLEGHMVHTDKNIGLTPRLADRAIELLNAPGESVCDCASCRAADEAEEFEQLLLREGTDNVTIVVSREGSRR